MEFEYVDVSSVSNESFTITATQRLKGKDAPSRARRLIRVNDVLFATVRPTLQRIAVVPPELDGQVCSTGYFVLRPAPCLDHRFLFYSLFTREFLASMEALQKGASYPAVNDSDIRAFRLSYPPLAEQQRIVGILDEAFAAIATAKANTEKNLQNARAVLESISHALVAHDQLRTIRLEDLASADCTLSYGIVQPGEDREEGLIVVRPVDLGPKVIRADGLKRIDTSRAKGYARSELRGNELLLCVRGTTGTIGIASEELRGGNVTRGLVPIRLDTKLMRQDFGYYALRSDVVQAQIRAKTYGAALMQINIKDVRNLMIPVPTLEEQDQAVSTLDSLSAGVDELAHLATGKLAALDALKASLLHHAFTGQLTATQATSIPDGLFPGLDLISNTELHAGVLAIGYLQHEAHGRTISFGHVKAEKLAHMAEAWCGIGLGRRPARCAAGPADFARLKEVEAWAERADAFKFIKDGRGYRFSKLRGFNNLVERASRSLGDRLPSLKRLLEVIVPMDKQEVEVFATVWAAWNNLLLSGKPTGNEDIVRAAREDWHRDKRIIDRRKFFGAIALIRSHELAPRGSGAFVP